MRLLVERARGRKGGHAFESTSDRADIMIFVSCMTSMLLLCSMETRGQLVSLEVIHFEQET